MIRYDPTLVDLTSNFFVLCTNVKVNLIYSLYNKKRKPYIIFDNLIPIKLNISNMQGS